jgi:hypothetical protein
MTNLIDNLVANWSEAARRARNDGYFERASGFDDCCADLRTHAAEIERNARDAETWISVDEKLPDMDMPVWLYGDGGAFIGGRSYVGDGEWGWCNSYNQFWLERDGSWSADLAYDDDYHVTHWKPLPEIPSLDIAMREGGGE